MHISTVIKACIAAVLLVASSLGWAQSFRIASQAEDGWSIDVQGSATLQRQDDGVVIRFDALTVAARPALRQPLYIAALRFNGDDVTGTGTRTSLTFSERAPVGQWLAPGAVLPLKIATPLFMRLPGWHQNDPRFDLDVLVRIDGQESWIPVATTLHTLKLPSDFSRRNDSPIRDSGSHPDIVVYGLLMAGAVLAYLGLMRWRKARGKEVFLGLVVWVFVWTGGVYPLLQSAYSVLWTRTNAQVVDSSVRDIAPAGKQRAYRYAPVVKYQYDVAGKTFSNTQLQYNPPPSYASRDEALEALRAWDALRIAGQTVTVWVNPLDPSDAVLSREPKPWSLLVCCVGLVGMFLLLRKKRGRAA